MGISSQVSRSAVKMPHNTQGLLYCFSSTSSCSCSCCCCWDPSHYAASLTRALCWRRRKRRRSEQERSCSGASEREKIKETKGGYLFCFVLFCFYRRAENLFFKWEKRGEWRRRGERKGGGEKLLVNEETWGTRGAWTSTLISEDTTCLWNCPCLTQVNWRKDLQPCW